MNYKEKYEQALERARKLYDSSEYVCEMDNYVTIFPELKESDDKQSKEWILEYLYDGLRKSDEQFKEQFKTAITCLKKHWLESKDTIELELKEKPSKDQVWDYCNKISREWYQITMDKWETLTDEEKDKYNQFIGFNDFSDMLMNITAGALFQLRDTGKLEYEEGSLLLERPDEKTYPILSNSSNIGKNEQKHTDKVEPKFKVGNWIICKRFFPARIVNIDDDKYEIEFTDNGRKRGFPIDYIDRIYHHWTIEDAKDGDVLTYRLDSGRVLIMIYEGLGESFDGQVNVHALLDGDGYFDESAASVCCKFMELLTPATKEQRELLFSKMEKAGYKWDADEIVIVGFDYDDDERHEELIEDDEISIKQNPSWSKEDEEMFNSIIEDVMPCGECSDYPTDEEREYFYEGNRKVEWFKSLKDRVQLKLTVEQMKGM